MKNWRSTYYSFPPSSLLASTVFHSLELGFRTILIDDCSRGIDGADIDRTFEKIREQNGLVVQSSEVNNPSWRLALRTPARLAVSSFGMLSHPFYIRSSTRDHYVLRDQHSFLKKKNFLCYVINYVLTFPSHFVVNTNVLRVIWFSRETAMSHGKFRRIRISRYFSLCHF